MSSPTISKMFGFRSAAVAEPTAPKAIVNTTHAALINAAVIATLCVAKRSPRDRDREESVEESAEAKADC
ncbi:MAG TPA: hypothetical protein PLV92_00710 [Pirellulaceae bacterium]|nr:hypothetical protein [Pirellulaceae bacterium]